MHITKVLEQTEWRIEGPKGAALILGLHPSTARSRMLKLGIRKQSGARTYPVRSKKLADSESARSIDGELTKTTAMDG
jgi:hypothetical protein